jgi:hypothetical protein
MSAVTLTSTVRFYPKAQDKGSGLDHVQVRTLLVGKDGQVPSGWFRPSHLQRVTASSFVLTAEPGATRCAQVRAVDAFGNASEWSGAQCRTMLLDDRQVPRRGAWFKGFDTAAYKGTFISTKDDQAVVSLDVARSSRILVRGDRCPTCGELVVRTVDGIVGRVSMASTSVQRGAIVALPVFRNGGGPVGRLQVEPVLGPGESSRLDGLAAGQPVSLPSAYEPPIVALFPG